MIQKKTYGFNSFAAKRIGEIQEETDKANWYWAPRKLNIDELHVVKRLLPLAKMALGRMGLIF